MVLARLRCPFHVDAIDVEVLEVAGTGAMRGGPAQAEVPTETLAICFPAGLDGVDGVGNGPAIDKFGWVKEVVEELGDLVRA